MTRKYSAITADHQELNYQKDAAKPNECVGTTLSRHRATHTVLDQFTGAYSGALFASNCLEKPVGDRAHSILRSGFVGGLPYLLCIEVLNKNTSEAELTALGNSVEESLITAHRELQSVAGAKTSNTILQNLLHKINADFTDTELSFNINLAMSYKKEAQLFAAGFGVGAGMMIVCPAATDQSLQILNPATITAPEDDIEDILDGTKPLPNTQDSLPMAESDSQIFDRAIQPGDKLVALNAGIYKQLDLIITRYEQDPHRSININLAEAVTAKNINDLVEMARNQFMTEYLSHVENTDAAKKAFNETTPQQKAAARALALLGGASLEDSSAELIELQNIITFLSGSTGEAQLLQRTYSATQHKVIKDQLKRLSTEQSLQLDQLEQQFGYYLGEKEAAAIEVTIPSADQQLAISYAQIEQRIDSFSLVVSSALSSYISEIETIRASRSKLKNLASSDHSAAELKTAKKYAEALAQTDGNYTLPAPARAITIYALFAQGGRPNLKQAIARELEFSLDQATNKARSLVLPLLKPKSRKTVNKKVIGKVVSKTYDGYKVNHSVFFSGLKDHRSDLAPAAVATPVSTL